MEIGRQFNKLTLKEYQFYIDNYKKYTDFNTLGLYRSILENQKLSADERIAVREYAHKTFKKTFDFLQLKDPRTYVEVCKLGQELTEADEWQMWRNVKENQQKILAEKKIKQRNFGVYSKHDCGYDTCPFNGLMITQGSWFAENEMHFDDDNKRSYAKYKSEMLKSERKKEKQIIRKELDENA